VTEKRNTWLPPSRRERRGSHVLHALQSNLHILSHWKKAKFGIRGSECMGPNL